MTHPGRDHARQVTLTPASDIPPQVPRHDWGPWRLRRNTRELYLDSEAHVDCQHYTIQLDGLDRSAELLDFICQVAAKTWADADTVAGLVWALSDILDPQANICSWGKDRTISPADIRRLVASYRPGRS